VFKRILHATDFSAASTAAFARALALARASRAPLLLLHVRAPVIPMIGDGYVSPAAYEELERSSRAWADGKMRTLLAKAKAAKVKATALVVDGIAHEQIARVAKRKRADLLVLGTHGRTGVARMFLGSVAGRVAAMAPAPVLTVRGK
jgi:nucleotide-binding universal stress UspA family protein